MKAIGVFCVTISMIAAGSSRARQERLRLKPPLGLDEYFFVPEDNPLTLEKIDLGRRLFFDPLLSAERSIACATCHKPELAFSDGLAVSVGVSNRKGTRNTPAIFNRTYGRSFFWDGRVKTLEEQALQPIQSSIEMNLPLDELVTRLQSDAIYAKEFSRVFPDGISPGNVARALASFVRTLRSGNSAFDRFERGDREALSVEARRGLELFRGKANCVACHVGPNLTDEQFHNTGVAWRTGEFADVGRYAVSRREEDLGAFKTPTLRNVSRTAPYMHDGSIATLEAVIEYYSRGGNANPHLDPEVHPLRLTTDERRLLVTFLEALTQASATVVTSLEH